MHIVFKHDTPIPVQKYGGTERMLFWHMRQLRLMGHKITFIGPTESAVTPLGIHHISYQKKTDGPDWQNLIPDNADLVHLQYNSEHALSLPFICTMHGNAQPGEILNPQTIFVSKSQATHHNGHTFVHNALDFDEYTDHLLHLKKVIPQYEFLFLAKASWKVKNLSDTVESCKKANRHLHIAGGRNWTLSPYIHSHGMVTQEEKISLLKKTSTLLFPVRWHEPFGLAPIEALAMGNSVIASSFGALPELIDPSVGILVKNKQELLEAILNKKNFSPEACHQHAKKHFHIAAYSEKYLHIYRETLQGKIWHQEPLRWIGTTRPEDLLPFDKEGQS
jgi:hypothetical protein